jgi:KDO2-lipid IV(A) lauroyltransferase
MLDRLVILPLLRALAWLAVDTASRVGGSLGVLVFHLGVRRRVASGCLHTAMGLTGARRRAIIRRSYASIGASFVELWSIGGVDGGERHLTTANPTWLKAVLARHPGCVFLTPHLGNWDLGAHGLARLTPKLLAYAKAQHNPAVDAAANRQRARAGITVLLTHHNDRTTAIQVLRALRSGTPVGLIADQGPSSTEGVRAVFMGVETYCHAGPGFFAKRTAAPIIPGLCVRRRAGEFVLVVGRPLAADAGDEAALVQAAMDLLGAMIAAVPGQYFWQHRRFKNHLGAATRVEPWKTHGLRLLADPLQALPCARP